MHAATVCSKHNSIDIAAMGKKSRSKATNARKPPPPPLDPLDAVHAAATTPAWLVATRDEAVAVQLLESLERAVAKLPRTSPPMSGPTDATRAALYAWAKERGCACENVRLESYCDGQTRVVAATRIEGVVLSVPAPLHLRATDDASDVMGVAAFAERHNLDATLALALRLCAEAGADDSPWSHYVQCLPATFDVPTFWAFEDVARLRGSESFRRACMSRCAAARSFVVVTRSLGDDAAQALALDYERWRWALGAVQTRQNSLGGTLALVPLWDMCNHAVDAGSSQLTPDGALELVAAGVEEEEEVRMDYGARSAANFLLHSGFVPPPSIREGGDTATVDVSLPETPLAPLLARFLDSRGVPRAPAPPRAPPRWRGALQRMVSTAGGAHAVPDAALNAVALAAGADKDDATYLLRCAPGAALIPASAAHADRATQALAAATVAQASGYPALPAPTTAHGRLADALVSREKEMLRRGKCKGKTA